MGKTVAKIVDVSTLGVVDSKKLMGGEKPKLGDPEEMPDADSNLASKRAMRESQRRRRTGRTSTILSTSSLG